MPQRIAASNADSPTDRECALVQLQYFVKILTASLNVYKVHLMACWDVRFVEKLRVFPGWFLKLPRFKGQSMLEVFLQLLEGKNMQTLPANEISVVSGGEPGPVIVIPAGFWYQFKEPGMSMEEIAAEWEFEHNGMCGP